MTHRADTTVLDNLHLSLTVEEASCIAAALIILHEITGLPEAALLIRYMTEEVERQKGVSSP